MLTSPESIKWLTVTVVLVTAGAVVAAFFAGGRLKSRRRYSFEDVGRLIGVVVAIAAVTFPLVANFLNRPITGIDTKLKLESVTEERLSALEHDLKAIEESISALRTQLAQGPTGQQGDGGSISPAALLEIEQKLKKSAESVQKFEALLLTDASRLVTLPLMQRDFQSIKDDLLSVKDNVNGLRTLIAETGGQNRWVIGTLALGMLGLVIPAIRSLFASSKREGTKSEEPKVCNER